MNIRFICYRDVPIPEGATHIDKMYAIDDTPVFYKMTMINEYSHWWHYRNNVWVFYGHTKPYDVIPITETRDMIVPYDPG